jgi:putative flippase GtrA
MATFNERLRSGAIRPTEWIEQGAKFILVGLMNTGIDIGLYFTLTRFLAIFAEANVVAKAISYAAGVLNSYLWNRSWTFKSRDRSWKTFAPFMLSNLIGLSINAAVLWLGLLLSIPEILALVIATSVTLVWNFIISKLVIFNR